jgi:tetratricopeptide (TPR) repeat protein
VRLDPRPGSYVLSSRLRALGDRIRYEAALDAPDGERLWSEKCDGSLSDGFDWQDETASAVATLAFRRILIHSARNLEAVPPHARSAEQWATLALIRGSADGESHRRALDCLWEAIGKAPDWGYAYALALAVAMGGQSLGHVEHIRPYLKHVDHWIERVEALEPEVSPSRIMLAFARLVRTKDPMEVRGALRSLLQGLPFEPDVLIWAGYCRLYIGEPEAALECFEKFQKGVVLDAYAPAVRAGAAGALLQMGRFEEALEAAEQALRINPLYPSPLRIAAAALAHLGRETEAQAMVARLLTVAPQESLSDLRARSGYCETPAVQLYFEGLARAGLPA